MDFSSDGRTLVSSGDDGTVRLADMRSSSALGMPMLGHDHPVNGAAFSPDGRIVASVDEPTIGAGNEATLRFWDARTRALLGGPVTDDLLGSSLAWSADGRLLATPFGLRGSIRLWNARTHQPRGAPLTGDGETTKSPAFSRDGRTLASGGQFGSVRFWDERTRKPLGKPFAVAAGRIRGTTAHVAFRPDGRTLASGGADETVRLWDVPRRRPLGTLTGHRGRPLPPQVPLSRGRAARATDRCRRTASRP